MPENISQALMTHHFAGGLYAKELFLSAGQTLIQHQHHFDHLSVLAKGTVIVAVNGNSEEYTGPICITIKAGQHHGIVAKTDAVWYCIHAIDCDNPHAVEAILVQPTSDEELQAAQIAASKAAGGTVEQELVTQAAKKIWGLK